MEASAETLDIISGEKKPAILNYSPEIIAELEEIETDEIIHYMEDEAVSPFLSILPLLNDDNKINDEVFDLEDISNGFSGGVSLFNRPFAFSQDNPKMLQGISYNIRNEVLYEENGIHYISNSVFDNDSGMEKELNNGFAKLVESVVNKI
ncbi:MAG: hypothetical protein LBG95_03320 [Treponema sp.]|nr:hypothetical protein [Treponema sp.]